MANLIKAKSALKAGLLAGVLSLSAGPAWASICGHVYNVSTPTTLGAVAKACQLSLIALHEANPQAAGRMLESGERVQLPSPTQSAAHALRQEWAGSSSADQAQADEQNAKAQLISADDITFVGPQPVRHNTIRHASRANLARANAQKQSGQLWSGGYAPTANPAYLERLSFQKRSRLQINTAHAIQTAPIIAPVDFLSRANFVASNVIAPRPALPIPSLLRQIEYKDGESPTIHLEGATYFDVGKPAHYREVRRIKNTKTGQVVEISHEPVFAAPRSASANDADVFFAKEIIIGGAASPKNKLGVHSRPSFSPVTIGAPTHMRGIVFASEAHCALVYADDGTSVAIHGLENADALIGKRVNLQGTRVSQSRGKSCRGADMTLKANHLTFAEPILAD